MTGSRTAGRRSGLVVPTAVVLAAVSACTVGARTERPEGTERPEDAALPEQSVPAPPDLLPDDEVTPATDPPRPAAVDVVVSLADWDPATASVLVGGYVSPVVEEGGTCTVELERAGRIVRREAPATPDATTTVCGGFEVGGAELEPGTWTVVLRYASPSVTGTSAPVDVEVTA